MKFIIHTDKSVILRKASILLQAQNFGLVTPEPFSLRELGGVLARDYILIFQGQGKHSISWYSLVSFPDPLKRKRGSGKRAGVEVYTAEYFNNC